MNRNQLDAWITGNYGEDHPNNVEHECLGCGKILNDDDYDNKVCGRCNKDIYDNE